MTLKETKDYVKVILTIKSCENLLQYDVAVIMVSLYCNKYPEHRNTIQLYELLDLKYRSLKKS